MIRRAALAVIALLAAAELLIHVSRINDFPIYHADNRIGYIPKPSQSGRFLWRNDWVTNELSMGTAKPFAPSSRTDLLLIGDSIVFGGNPLAQRERLGPALEKATGWTVWPISAGSWGLQNEIRYLVDHPQVTSRVDRIAFVLNDSDFGEPSSYRSPYITPLKSPLPALPYILKRYVFGFTVPDAPSPALAVPTRDPVELLDEFAARYGKPIDVFLYSARTEIGTGCRWSPVAKLRTIRNIRLACIEKDDRWIGAYYRDNAHPSAAGNGVLASIMAGFMYRSAPRTH